MGPTVQSVCPIPLYRGTARDSIGLYQCVLYGAHCPECLSHPAVPWDYTGPHRNVPMCTVWGPLSRVSVPSHGTTQDSIGMYQCVLYGAHCPECLSHPVIPWNCCTMYTNNDEHVTFTNTRAYIHICTIIIITVVMWDHHNEHNDYVL